MPKAGPYFLYMMDFKKEKERDTGRSLSTAEVSQMASDSWNSMSEEDKEYYRAKAKGGEVRIPKRPGGAVGEGGRNLLTSQGVPVNVYEREQRQQKLEEETMRRRTGAMIQNHDLATEFLKLPIYLMYGNYFYKDDKIDEFSPAELALIRFTFHDGVTKKYHTFISPEKVALGFAWPAKSHSESTHRLTPPPDAIGEKNFGRILYDIKKFMGEDMKAFDGGRPIIFTYSDSYASDTNQIDVLKSFMKQFATNEANPFDFYPLTRLFYTLRKELAARKRVDDVPNERFCEVFLSNDPYDTTSGISCAFHEGIDATRYCALSRAQRWSFLLADHFCHPLGVRLMPGTHLPENADIPDTLSMESGSVSEMSVKKSKENAESDDESKTLPNGSSRSSIDSKSLDGTLDRKLGRDIRRSESTLDCELQSIRTSSTASDAASASGRKKPNRPTRTMLTANSSHGQSSSSTFYNP